ncbi:hypothetical protein [Desulfotomaculum copahuensis]|uniref:Uncharacterized protein n=1 Tax=Desulfotomaculum copahuensis TaxID=1838280 RepID=A0A1B7LAH9_9FIRM|nr:hypothetical protein [Desulfotomaculum copahuensis]OAT79344.1 hypothetical protein A6M21_15950 [Desulfotomaculum copahuensis]
MSVHELVRKLLVIDEKETVLWSEIATMVPTPALREVITRMIQMETRGVAFWRRVLGGMDGISAATFQIDMGISTGITAPECHTLVDKIKFAMVINAEQLCILADILVEVKSNVVRHEILRKIREEYHEELFWNTLLLCLDPIVVLFDAKTVDPA